MTAPTDCGHEQRADYRTRINVSCVLIKHRRAELRTMDAIYALKELGLSLDTTLRILGKPPLASRFGPQTEPTPNEIAL